MAIHFEYDADKLSPREAQIVAALVDVAMMLPEMVMVITGNPPRLAAETVLKILRRRLPDLDFRIVERPGPEDPS